MSHTDGTGKKVYRHRPTIADERAATTIVLSSIGRNENPMNILIGYLCLVLFLAFLPNITKATDCNANCESHFDKWYQKPDLERCKAERYAACKWGVEHCDLYTYDNNRRIITAVIQRVHDVKNDPQNVHQCYRYIDGGSFVHSIGENGYSIYQWAEGVASNFNPYAILVKETVKQILRCSCEAVNWTNQSGSSRERYFADNGATCYTGDNNTYCCFKSPEHYQSHRSARPNASPGGNAVGLTYVGACPE